MDAAVGQAQACKHTGTVFADHVSSANESGHRHSGVCSTLSGQVGRASACWSSGVNNCRATRDDLFCRDPKFATAPLLMRYGTCTVMILWS